MKQNTSLGPAWNRVIQYTDKRIYYRQIWSRVGKSDYLGGIF